MAQPGQADGFFFAIAKTRHAFALDQWTAIWLMGMA
jgi:hypothetical protein